jgi:hypothetical protein
MLSSIKRLLLVVLSVALLALLAWGLRTYPARLEADYWREQLAKAADPEAAQLLRQIPWDESSLPLLVEALNSTRPGLAEAARSALGESIDRWHALPAGRQTALLTALVHGLAADLERLDGPARRERAQLVTRILQSPLIGDIVDRSRMIALCDHVLSRLDDQAPSDIAGPTEVVDPAEDGRWGTSHGPADRESGPSSGLIEGLAKLPGGGLPLEKFSLPILEQPKRPEPMPEPIAKTPPKEPEGLRVPELTEPLPRPPSPRQDLPVSLGPKPAPSQAPRVGQQTHAPGGTTKATTLSEFRALLAAHSPPHESRALARVPILDLMRDLRSPDPLTVSQARAELALRGFSDLHMEFARRLFDPDPTVRQGLAQALPSVPGLDAAPWLLYLCGDEDAEVRLTAISLIVTTGNRALLEQAEVIARRDHDPRIQGQAEQISQLRRAGVLR